MSELGTFEVSALNHAFDHQYSKHDALDEYCYYSKWSTWSRRCKLADVVKELTNATAVYQFFNRLESPVWHS